jgi:hypothetical protein
MTTVCAPSCAWARENKPQETQIRQREQRVMILVNMFSPLMTYNKRCRFKLGAIID